MTNNPTGRPGRRTILRSAAAVLGVGAAGLLARPDAAAAEAGGDVPVRGLRVRHRFQLVDRKLQQRFRLSSSKPPVFLNGKVYERNGPEHGSYITFNDEHQDEKGGLTASTQGVSLSFDYPNTQAVTLSTAYEGDVGVAQLSMNEMPDPNIPPEDLPPDAAPRRALLYCDNAGNGSLLWLCDSAGNPRITLQVDGDDVPRIQILDADGGVVAQLPENAPARKSAPKLLGGLRSRLVAASSRSGKSS